MVENLHRAKSIFLSGDNREMLLFKVLQLLLLDGESLPRSTDKLKLSLLSALYVELGEFVVGRDMLRSILVK